VSSLDFSLPVSAGRTIGAETSGLPSEPRLPWHYPLRHPDLEFCCPYPLAPGSSVAGGGGFRKHGDFHGSVPELHVEAGEDLPVGLPRTPPGYRVPGFYEQVEEGLAFGDDLPDAEPDGDVVGIVLEKALMSPSPVSMPLSGGVG